MGMTLKLYSDCNGIYFSKWNRPRNNAMFCGVISGAILFAYVPSKIVVNEFCCVVSVFKVFILHVYPTFLVQGYIIIFCYVWAYYSNRWIIIEIDCHSGN